MQELIKKLEAATEGSRELDSEVFGSLGTHVLERRGRDRKAWWYKIGGKDYQRKDPSSVSYGGVPRFTSSIDAALTLVPEGWDWLITRCIGGRYCAIVNQSGTQQPAEVVTQIMAPALALTIVALTARRSV